MDEPRGDDDVEVRRLVSQASAGDAGAWETLYRRSYPRLFAFARRRLPNDDAADDAVGETITRALDRIDNFTWKGAGFDAWLFGVLRNVMLETYRRTARTTPYEEPPDTPVPDRLDAIVDRAQLGLVRTAFDRLSPDDQDVLELRVVAGLSADGVGEVMGREPGAVRTAQARALGRLRTLYRELSDAI